MSLNRSKITKNRLLISSPFLNDVPFNRAVVLLIEHNKEGSMGLIINKSTNKNLTFFTKEFGEFKNAVLFGGPIEVDKIFYIHIRPDIIGNSLKVFDNIYWGGNIDDIKNAIKNKLLLPSEILFFLGYSGWTSNQLENEVNNNWWAVSEAKQSDAFDNKVNLWSRLLSNLGDKYKLWLNIPENPLLN